MRVGARIGLTLRSRDTWPRVHCCRDPIPATWSGSGIILSLEIPSIKCWKRQDVGGCANVYQGPFDLRCSQKGNKIQRFIIIDNSIGQISIWKGDWVLCFLIYHLHQTSFKSFHFLIPFHHPSQSLGCFSPSQWPKTYSFKKGMYLIFLLVEFL